MQLPYFFGYKTVFYFLPKQSQNLDPSYKIDLNLLYCLGRVKVVLQQHFIGLI